MKLKINLDRILFERKISQTDLVRASGLSFGTINNLVNGKNKGLTLDTIGKLCSTLEVPVEQLIVADNDH